MKKAHELAYERWSYFTPKLAAEEIARAAKGAVGTGRGESALRLRITIRVEVVEKEDK